MSSANHNSGKHQGQNRRAEPDLGETLGEYIREEPLTSIAIAGAAGFIFGGGVKSRIGIAALAMVGKTALRGAATNLIVGLFFPGSKRTATGAQNPGDEIATREMTMPDMTMEERISAIQDERDDAREDLRDTLTEVNAKVGPPAMISALSA